MDYCRRINMITAKEAYDRAEKDKDARYRKFN